MPKFRVLFSKRYTTAGCDGFDKYQLCLQQTLKLFMRFLLPFPLFTFKRLFTNFPLLMRCEIKLLTRVYLALTLHLCHLVIINAITTWERKKKVENRELQSQNSSRVTGNRWENSGWIMLQLQWEVAWKGINYHQHIFPTAICCIFCANFNW